MLLSYKSLVAKNIIQYSAAQENLLVFLEKFDNKNKFFSKEKGVYIHGAVGRGKSMILDIFYNNTKISTKSRVHFHAFMQTINQRLFTEKINISVLVDQLFKVKKLLCLDELHLQDIGSAMVIKSLLLNFFKKRGVVIVTSNYKPEELYPHGVNRESFLEAIELIKEYMHVVYLEGDLDYRDKGSSSPYYFLGENSLKKLPELFLELTEAYKLETPVLVIYGRQIILNNFYNGFCWFNFRDLFENLNYGPTDYHVIAKKCRMIFIDFIPILSNKDIVRKFIIFIDELYEANCYLACCAATTPENLSNSLDFLRTASRIKALTSKLPNFS